MNLQRNDWFLNRRHMLKGLGVSMALPMLDCMRSSVVGASELPPPTPPTVLLHGLQAAPLT